LANLAHVEVIVWFGWRLILDILGPHLIGDVAMEEDNVTDRWRALEGDLLEGWSRALGCSSAPAIRAERSDGAADPVLGGDIANQTHLNQTMTST
jgi:hypothetical protein